MVKALRDLANEIQEIRLDIKSEFGAGYQITSKGAYDIVPDEMGKTETRMLLESDQALVLITRMEGPRGPRKEKFQMDMEVELTRGNLKYTFPETGRVVEMEFQKPLYIKAGTEFTYEFSSEIMCCVFKMIK